MQPRHGQGYIGTIWHRFIPSPVPMNSPSLRYRLSVCPHDTAKNIAAWFLINTYLQKRLGLSMRFEPSDNFHAEREQVLAGGYQLVYANPFSALQYVQQRGFTPVARPVGVFDETLLVTREGMTLEPGRALKVATATDKLIVHFLGLTLLDGLGIRMGDCEFVSVGTHQKAAQAVLDGRCDAGFVFNETWQGLSGSTRAGLAVAAQTRSRQASHCFCVGPELAERADEIRDLLCTMSTDPAGQRVLEDLRFTGFEAMPADAVATLQALVRQSA